MLHDIEVMKVSPQYNNHGRSWDCGGFEILRPPAGSSRWLYFFTHIELQLPATAVASHRPKLEHARFGDYGF